MREPKGSLDTEEENFSTGREKQRCAKRDISIYSLSYLNWRRGRTCKRILNMCISTCLVEGVGGKQDCLSF